jgi:hypothetical protein
MAELPPPQVAAAAKTVQTWLNSQQPAARVSDAEFSKMSLAERLDYARQFPQTLESGRRATRA